MRRIIFIIGFSISFLNVFSQESNPLLEEIIEQIAENSNEELDYSELYEALYYFFEHPINLNKTTKEELQQLHFLNAFQINKLLTHINKNGKLLSYLELQSITGFNTHTIKNLLPFISIRTEITSEQITRDISQHFIVRDQFYLQKQKGYIPDENGKIHYLGNSHRTYFKYRLKNQYLQAGITAEKDAGENFFGKNQPYGFDFYSAHIQAKDIGRIKKVILGDYQLSFGQGLVMQPSMTFGKSSEVINIQKSGSLIKPHTSAAENLFFRGTAIQTKPLKNLDIILFASSHKVDANIIDTLDDNLVYSSIQGNGMHRTENELKDKNVVLQNHLGLHSNYNYHNLNLGISYYNTKIDGNHQKNISSYNQFDFTENNNQNIGTDYQLLYKNMNIFGEIARSKNGGTAHLNGVMIGLDKTISASLLYRKYSKDYQSEYANGFSERETQNEEGIYLGLEFTPNHKFKIKAYADNYEFPWLRYGVNAPSKGNDYLLQANYRINRATKMYIRYKSEEKGEQLENTLSIENKRKDNFRFHINFKNGENWSFANRFETSLISFNNAKSTGYMIYQDIKYKPLFTKFSFTSRYALFNISNYESRIYSYENDVLYSYSIPAYYGVGNKFYLVAKYNPARNIDLWVRFSHTIFTDRETIKSGWDEIKGNKMTEIKLQLRYKF